MKLTIQIRSTSGFEQNFICYDLIYYSIWIQFVYKTSN